jgi:ubiquinone/menaquinone biosynthesis C-methylase UbiE
MQEADRTLRAFHFMAHEQEPLEADRLGPDAHHRRVAIYRAAIAAEGKVHGIDYSEESVAASRRYNAQAIRLGRVEIQLADVGKLPFPDNTFDLVTGVETHFWWPDIAAGFRETRRVLKPGGTLILIAEVYKGADTTMSRLCEKYAPITGMKMLTSDEHRDLLASVGFADVRIDALAAKGWITAQGRK